MQQFIMSCISIDTINETVDRCHDELEFQLMEPVCPLIKNRMNRLRENSNLFLNPKLITFESYMLNG